MSFVIIFNKLYKMQTEVLEIEIEKSVASYANYHDLEQGPKLQLEDVHLEVKEDTHISEVLSLNGIISIPFESEEDSSICSTHRIPEMITSFHEPKSPEEMVKSNHVIIPLEKQFNSDEHAEEQKFLSPEKNQTSPETGDVGLDYDQINRAPGFIEILPKSLTQDVKVNKIVLLEDVKLSLSPEPALGPMKVDVKKIHIIEDPANFEALKVSGEKAPKNNGPTVIVEVVPEGPPCEICYEAIPKDKDKKPLDCKHMFCHQCYINYLNEKIATGKLIDIKCPDEACTQLFTDDQIKGLLPDQKFQEYSKFKRNQILNQNPNLRWCVRVGCGKYTTGKDGDEKVVCECGTEICFKCRSEYHPKKTCEQAVDNAYKQYLKTHDVQKCPRCKSGIEKMDGCNHMKCSVCYYEWCWLCGGKYSRNHYSLLNPLGCGGLQRGRNTRAKWPWWKRYLLRMLQLLILLLLLPIAICGFVIFSMLIPNIIYSKYFDRQRWRRRYNRRRRGPCCVCLLRFFLLIVGIATLPIGMLITLCLGVSVLWQKLRRR